MKTKTLDREQPSISHLPREGEGGFAGSATLAELTRRFTLMEGADSDTLIGEIMQEDCEGMKTPLQLMKAYADILSRETSHGNIDDKLDRLFAYGKAPRAMDGYHHGITLSLKTGTDLHRMIGNIRERLHIGREFDPLQVLYARLASRTSPWAGKNFKALGGEKLRRLTGGFESGRPTAYLGINSFRKAEQDFMNNLSAHILSFIIDMEEMPGPESKQRSWIYAKGGLFIAKRQLSVDPDQPEKEVLALNYRWKNLGNGYPNKLLIDEIVQIADGLYLGKLFYATSLRRVLEDFDPRLDREDYKYRPFGYFLLMDDTWEHEKNQLFPEHICRLADNLPEKFSTFQLVDSPQSEKIKGSLGEGKTVLHYLQGLSDKVKEGAESEEKFLKEIHNLFMCGQRPDGIQGFLHGGVAAFRRGGFLKKISKDILNRIWPAIRPFSPWTGKTFTEAPLEGIVKYIGKDAAHYRGTDPIIVGTNTYRRDLDLSLPVTAFVEHVDKVGMFVEYPDEAEKDEDIYVKSFFFIASNRPSVDPSGGSKEVLQFNYRWENFHTLPPDNLCIDELVRIADGLFLGKLLYATNVKVEYDATRNPADYGYQNFGYFMLMDDDWWAIKEFIRFDTE